MLLYSTSPGLSPWASGWPATQPGLASPEHLALHRALWHTGCAPSQGAHVQGALPQPSRTSHTLCHAVTTSCPGIL